MMNYENRCYLALICQGDRNSEKPDDDDAASDGEACRIIRKHSKPVQNPIHEFLRSIATESLR